MHPSNTYWRSALALVSAVATALVVDACGTNERTTFVADVSDASTAPDGVAPDGAICGELDKPCCANESCSAAGTFCSVGGICKLAHPTDVGSRCATGSSCMSGLCTRLLGVDNTASPVCSQPCNENKDCVAGWACSAVGQEGFRGTCMCSPVAEICDGVDNDCNGKVDDAPLADDDCTGHAGIPQKCVDGECTCATPCQGGCVNATSDNNNNCGACGHACAPGVQVCAGSTCVCAGTFCPVPDGGMLGDAGYIIPDGGDGGGPIACVQTQSDTSNCGGCGVTCKYSCSNGGCVPLKLADVAMTGTASVVSTGKNVFIMTDANGGVVETCAIAGCNQQPSQVASGLHNTNNTGSAGHLAVGGGGAWVYWPEQTSVASMAVASPTQTVFAQPANSSVVAVATSATSVFWSDANLGILTCAIGATCASPTILLAIASLPAAPVGIVADDTYVYWTDAKGNLSSYPIAGGSQVTLATGIADGPPVAMSAAAGRVYFGGLVDPLDPFNTVLGTALGGVASSATLYHDAQTVLAVTTDGTNVYWSDGSQILKCAVGASCTTPTAPWGGVSAQSIAVDANNIYWIDTMQPVWAVWEFRK